MKEDFFSLNFLIALALILSIGLVTYNAFLIPNYAPAQVLLEVSSSLPEEETQQKDPNALVNINTATLDELQTIPGIGPVLAGRILQYRAKVGVILEKEELYNVSGIGDIVYEQIAPHIVIE